MRLRLSVAFAAAVVASADIVAAVVIVADIVAAAVIVATAAVVATEALVAAEAASSLRFSMVSCTASRPLHARRCSSEHATSAIS